MICGQLHYVVRQQSALRIDEQCNQRTFGKEIFGSYIRSCRRSGVYSLSRHLMCARPTSAQAQADRCAVQRGEAFSQNINGADQHSPRLTRANSLKLLLTHV